MYKQKSLSGVSIAIQNTMSNFHDNQPLVEKLKPKEFSIKIANTLEERAACFKLAYRVYLEKGYVNRNENEWLIHNYDANNETIILMVQDQQKNIAGSVTIVFDKDSKLPAEKIYGDELCALRNSGHKIAEISRLVIDPSYRNSKEILVLLFNYLCIYIHHAKRYTGLAITVNPRHKSYYQTILSFDEVGGEKPCPHVQNAPAVFLFLPTTRYQSEVKRCANTQNTDKKERSLYQYFLNEEQESLVAFYLKKQTKPMTASEKIFFGFSESNNRMAVAF